MFDGRKIRKIRMERKMIRKELAIRAEVPLRTLEDWESGRREPKNIIALNNISLVLGCYIDDFCQDGKKLYVSSVTNSYQKLVYDAVLQYSKELEGIEKKKTLCLCNRLRSSFLDENIN